MRGCESLRGLLLVFAALVGAIVLIVLKSSRPATTSTTISRWWGDILSYNTETNLVMGAIIDFMLGVVIVLLLTVPFGVRLPVAAIAALGLLPGIPKFLWSIDFPFFRNHVPTYRKGVATYLEEIVPSGPSGDGFNPGYYWLPLGRPFFKLAFTETTKEITIPFDNMEVWLRNHATPGRGGVKGRVHGNMQFRITDPAAFNAFDNDGGGRVVLDKLAPQAVRDVCEPLTAEVFIDTRNDALNVLADNEVRRKLSSRARPLGAELVGTNISHTDIENPAVQGGWERINVEESNKTSRKTDADARVERIRSYTGADVDADHAATLDAAASGFAGVTVGHQSYDVDIGEDAKDLAETLVNKIFK
jgi:hypothetical protein